MFNIFLQIKLIKNSEFLAKTIWVLNNFLTMEFYRKLCNNLYWKKLTPHTASYNTRFWMIVFTALSVIWLAFFYNPNDPTNSKSSGFLILLFALVLKHSSVSIHTIIKNLTGALTSTPDKIAFNILDSDNISLWRSRDTYLRTSALLI